MYVKPGGKPWVLRLAIAADQFFNVLLFNGSEDHTISGHVGYNALRLKSRRWLAAQKIINTLFWFDKDHCRKSIEWDEIR